MRTKLLAALVLTLAFMPRTARARIYGYQVRVEVEGVITRAHKGPWHSSVFTGFPDRNYSKVTVELDRIGSVLYESDTNVAALPPKLREAVLAVKGSVRAGVSLRKIGFGLGSAGEHNYLSERTTVLGFLKHPIKVKGVVTLLVELVYDEAEVRVVDQDVETRLYASLLDDGQGAPVTIHWPWLEAQKFEQLHAEAKAPRSPEVTSQP